MNFWEWLQSLCSGNEPIPPDVDERIRRRVEAERKKLIGKNQLDQNIKDAKEQKDKKDKPE